MTLLDHRPMCALVLFLEPVAMNFVSTPTSPHKDQPPEKAKSKNIINNMHHCYDVKITYCMQGETYTGRDKHICCKLDDVVQVHACLILHTSPNTYTNIQKYKKKKFK